MLEFADQVTVVGCGGIGTWLIPPLARFLSAEKFPGKLLLWDGDKFAEHNAARQEFSADAINRNKAETTLEALRRTLPGIQALAYDEYVTPETVDRAVAENSVVLTAVDNHPARALVTHHALTLKNVCVISAGNEKLDGNAHVFLRKNSKNLTGPIFDRHPEVAKAKKGERTPGCIDEINAGETQLLITNFAAAQCALLAFFNLYAHGTRFGRRVLTGVPQDVYFDVGAMKIEPVLREAS